MAVTESYSLDCFPDFYDAMVATLPPEYEPGEDVALYYSLLEVALRANGGRARVLDLCTGTGRVVEGLVQRLHRAPTCSTSTGTPPSPAGVEFVGVDLSVPMLDAAAAKLPAASLPAGTTCRWLPGDMARLPPAAELGGPFDLVILSAGSFHHLLTRDEQRACLAGVRRLLAPSPTARAVVNLLPSPHLRGPPGSVTLAGPFRRECLAEQCEACPDSGTIWRQTFLLSRLLPQQQGQPSAAAPGEAAVEAPLWQQQEGWALREVEPEEVLGLLRECGLAVVEQRASFGEGGPWVDAAAPGRVFVLAPAAT